MTTFIYIILGLAALGLIVWAINTRYVKTVLQVAKANLGEAASDLEARNALKLMNQGIVESAEQAKKARQGLVRVQSTCKELDRQVKGNAVEEARLTDRIKKAQAEGRKDDDQLLIQLATSLRNTREQLEANKKQLETNNAVYNDLLAQVSNAQRRGENLEREAKSLGCQLDTSALAAELADFTSTTTSMHQGLDGVAKYRDLVKKQIDENNSKLQVNRDLGASSTDVAKWEDHQDAKDILAELRGN